MSKPIIGIVMGSNSDLPVMEETVKILKEFAVKYELTISSAHRSPQKTSLYAKDAEKKGVEIIIAGAGGAAHLAGVLAAHTVLPIIAVPLNSPLGGLDSFYSTFQMPAGVPVATMGIGKSGAKNAAILAIEILALKYPEIRKKLKKYKEKLVQEVEKANKVLKKE